MTIPLTDGVRDAVADSLGGAYDCLRVWSAWGVGTMGEDDFQLVTDDSDRVEEIAQAAVDALPPLYAAAPDLLAALEATVKEAEQAECEVWVDNECPSGDAESVHRQWEASSEYRSFCEHWMVSLDAIAKARGEA
jgi:hypothetical protein